MRETEKMGKREALRKLLTVIQEVQGAKSGPGGILKVVASKVKDAAKKTLKIDEPTRRKQR